MHADIGGGYPENELRLSDITLNWMLEWASLVPGSLKHDPTVLVRWPYREGIRARRSQIGIWTLVTTLFGLTWTEKKRRLPGPDAVIHRSVYERFDLNAAPDYDEIRAYRPETLKTQTDFAPYYLLDAPFPAHSLQTATAVADDPAVIATRLKGL